MSVHLDWKQSYALGIQQVDEQHRYFLGLINRLSNELGRTDNAAYQAALLQELTAYARFHFVSEENLMLKANYPRFEEHRQHHVQLIDTLSSKLTLVKLNQTNERINAMLEFLLDWFMRHTTVEDRMFADYLEGASKE